MQRNVIFFRLLFVIITVLAATSYELSVSTKEMLVTAIILGLVKGAAISFLVFVFEAQVQARVKQLSLRSINTAVIGIVIGAALGWAITNALKTLFSLFLVNAQTSPTFDFFALAIYLGSLYFSLLICYTASEKWWLSIPFVKLTPSQEAGQSVNKKEILVDLSALEDTRLIDLARTGLLDGALVIPTFITDEIQKGLESLDEAEKHRFRKCQENLKRLEIMPHLACIQKAFSVESTDSSKNILRAARLANCAILSSDNQNLKQEQEPHVQIICIESIANSIKPTAQRGETLTIKIQRPGKEPKQGVGYLDDGTMVVVNGGGDFLGKTISTQVLSQKYSSSGKIIFCNALQSEDTSIGNTPYYVPQSQRQEVYAAQVPRYKKENNDSRQWN